MISSLWLRFTENRDDPTEKRQRGHLHICSQPPVSQVSGSHCRLGAQHHSQGSARVSEQKESKPQSTGGASSWMLLSPWPVQVARLGIHEGGSLGHREKEVQTDRAFAESVCDKVPACLWHKGSNAGLKATHSFSWSWLCCLLHKWPLLPSC